MVCRNVISPIEAREDAREIKRAARKGRSSEIQLIQIFVAVPAGYFFSSVGGGGAAIAGGAAGVGGGVVAGVSPRMPSLKLRTPSPIPRMNSGIFFVPNSNTTTTAMISRCHGENSITAAPSRAAHGKRALPGGTTQPQPATCIVTRSAACGGPAQWMLPD
jgi:hypothetical protein